MRRAKSKPGWRHMSDLATLQQRFSAALADVARGDEAVALVAGDPAHALNRLAIYRGNVIANVSGALAATYPIIRKLVGNEFFAGLVRAYWRERPSGSGDLNQIGERFADFVGAFLHTQSLPYLPDVARLEWLAHRAHYAGDHAALDMGSLASIPEDDYPRLALTLHPAVATLASSYPIFRIWEVHQDDYRGEISVDLASGADQVVVYRPHFRVMVAALSGGESAFLGAIMQGKRLDDALQQAATKDAGFNLSASLKRWIAANIVVGLNVAA